MKIAMQMRLASHVKAFVYQNSHDGQAIREPRAVPPQPRIRGAGREVCTLKPGETVSLPFSGSENYYANAFD